MDSDSSMIELKATSCICIPYMQDKDLPKAKIEICKIDRNHGTHDTNCHPSENHIYSEMNFISKKLGKDLGANINKTIELSLLNPITYAIKASMKNLIKSRKYDISNSSSISNV